jgi:signal peptidase II
MADPRTAIGKGNRPLLYPVAFLVFVLDQGIKAWIQTHMTLGQTIPVIPGVFDIHFIRNPGAAWGILGHARWLLVAVAVAVSTAVVAIARRYRLTMWNRIGLALVLGGALGNLWDRVTAGTVVDYLYVEAIHFPVFNLADSAVCVGVAMLLLGSFRQGAEAAQSTGEDRSTGEDPGR